MAVARISATSFDPVLGLTKLVVLLPSLRIPKYCCNSDQECACRKVIADAVRRDPETYSEAFLGKSNAEYQRWILDSQKWGGAIELSILSRHAVLLQALSAICIAKLSQWAHPKSK